MPVTNDINALVFAKAVADKTGLDPLVVLAWAQAEGADVQGGTGHFNYLNVRPKGNGVGYSGVQVGSSPGGFAEFHNVSDAIQETSYWINSMPKYEGIRTAAKAKDPTKEIAAIAASSWDPTSHYAGGKNLVSAYNAVASQAKTPGVQKYFQSVGGVLGHIPFIGGGAKSGADAVGSVAGGAQTAVGDVASGTEAVGNAIGWVMNPAHLLRLGYIIGGGLLVMGGLLLVARSVGAPTPSMPSLPGGADPEEARRLAYEDRQALRDAERVERSPKLEGERDYERTSQTDEIPY